MATLHLMVGLPCSGKTTYAKDLAARENALLLTPDIWHIKLFGQDFPGEYYEKRYTAIEGIMWDIAKKLLPMGTSIILDYGFWARNERDVYRQRAKDLGVSFRIHFIDVSKDELFARLEQRNNHIGDEAFHVPPENMEQWYDQFECPTHEEIHS